MSGITMKVTGIDEVLKKLDTKGMETKITSALKVFGEDVAQGAKQLAPVDEGFLKGQIGSKSETLKVEIFCNCDYAAYLEFGTRKFAAAYVNSLPPKWKEFAAQFKGRGRGSFNDFVQAIMAWVQRKGIGALKTKSGNASGSRASLDAMQQAAYWIALNIIRNGIKPHPFMFPSFEKQYPILIQDLKNLLGAK